MTQRLLLKGLLSKTSARKPGVRQSFVLPTHERGFIERNAKGTDHQNRTNWRLRPFPPSWSILIGRCQSSRTFDSPPIQTLLTSSLWKTITSFNNCVSRHFSKSCLVLINYGKSWIGLLPKHRIGCTFAMQLGEFWRILMMYTKIKWR